MIKGKVEVNGTEVELTLDKKLDISDVIVSCPKCNSSWIGDIGYGNCECWMCGNVFKFKSKSMLPEATMF